MSARQQREFLKTQLLETEHLVELAGDHPLMSVALNQRQKELQQQLEALPPGQKEARTVLFFHGNPVHGSMGIDSSFASRVLEPFQNMVKADYADRWHGSVGSRGRRTGEAQSRLLLTGLPRGSFGLELTKAPNDELFEEDQLADTLAHLTKLVESSARSDEDFASELDETAPRVIQNLREFLEVVAKGKAGLRLESGDYQCAMTPNEASDAFERVNGTVTKEEEVAMQGVFRGALLDSWRFDFFPEQGSKISGKVDDSLSPEEVEAMMVSYFNKSCQATMVKTTVLFKNGRVRTTWTLKNLR